MKILVCGPSWVGDMVMAQSLFKTLKKLHEGAVVNVLAQPWSLPILSRMPEVDQCFELPVGHGELGIKKRFQAGMSLLANHYDQAIIVPRSVKPALVPFFARIPVRTGYSGQGRFLLINDARKLDKKTLTMTVQRQVALAYPKSQPYPPPVIPQPCLQVDKDNQRMLKKNMGLALDRPVIAFFPGAEYGPSKQWPIDNFRTLASELVEKGYQVWIFGGPQDKEHGRAISQNRSDHIRNLAGKTSLNDAIDLIAAADMAVTNDSGLMHIAAAVGVHVEAIYGATTPDYTPPLTHRKNIHYLGVECSPCFKRKCPMSHFKCMRGITVSMVMESLSRAAGQS
jgi:heptosyltransferase-2